LISTVSEVILGLHRASRDYSVETFQDAAFELVKSAVPFDSAGWMTGRLTPGEDDTIFNTLHLYNQPIELIKEWRRTNDRTSLMRRVFASPGVTLSCVVQQELAPELADHCRRYRVAHILATASIDPVTGLNETISLWRTDPDRPFTEEERRTQQALVPHLVETWRINRILRLAGATQQQGLSLSCPAAVDGFGILHLIDPGFTRLLQGEWPDGRGARLPNELVSAIEQGRQQFVGGKIVVTISHLHNQFLLRGREKSVIDTLGRNKLAVAMHFSNGYTYKEIAQLLGLSPATVRNYLASIYEKLGVTSKVELAHALRSRDLG